MRQVSSAGWLAAGKAALHGLARVASAALLCLVAMPAVAAEIDEVRARDAAWLERLRLSREALEWTDELVRHDWRLQRRPGTDECRLLDARDRVVCTGDEAACRVALETHAASGQIKPVHGPAVILLHGLGEGRESMQPLAGHLREAVDATVLSFGYASVKADIDAHARALASVVAGLDGADRISFVGHSLGNLVVRRWMALATADDLARAHRMVMLGPPNQGSELARMAGTIAGLAARAEGAARDLAVDWNAVAPRLAVPPCDFAIVAGGRGDDEGYSPLLSGDDDAVVRVAETRLPGAAGFLVVPVHHAAMMRHRGVQRATAAFLATGRLPPAEASGADRP
jgi:alpha-beta hydrolase superfamily lysophospholipase